SAQVSARADQPSASSSGAGALFGTLADEPTAEAVASMPLSPPEQAALLEAWHARLASGLHGLCFSPYLDGQGPGSQLGEAQIRARLASISPHTRWVRSFSCTDGNE
ncbi:glycosyl hydrolase family 17 protein, partial [Roseateles sp. GG27B]